MSLKLVCTCEKKWQSILTGELRQKPLYSPDLVSYTNDHQSDMFTLRLIAILYSTYISEKTCKITDQISLSLVTAIRNKFKTQEI